MKYEQQFLDAIAGAGYEAPTKLIADGELHRFSSNGKPNDDSGWYVLHADYLPAGSFGCWRDGQTHTWRADIGRDYSPDEQLFMRERMEAQRQKREAEKEARQKEAKLRARNLWATAMLAGGHEYLTRKGIKTHGVKRHGNELIVPVRQGNEITSLQFISPEGDKRFLSGGKVQGGYYSIGNPKDAPALCVCEGFATGASINEATGLPVAVAFNAGNLAPVAQAMRDRFPELPIIVCADDDYLTEGNTGIAKANEAAQSVGGCVAIPQFGENRPEKATDFNDLALHLGNDAVKACIDEAMSDQNAGGEATPLPDDEKTPETLDRDALMQWAASLSPIDYDQQRDGIAKQLGVRTATLDSEIKKLRKDADRTASIEFDEVEPWRDAVALSDVLDLISGTILRFIVCDRVTADAAALWVVMTWLMDTVKVAPLAVITAPEKRCGKSQMLSVIGRMVCRPLQASNISAAALYRVVEAHQPTLLIDETDAFLKDNEDMRGIINSGHTPDSAYVIRLVGDDHAPVKFSTWGAKALSGIGTLADTIMDRAVVLQLRRKMPHESVERLRHAEPELFEEIRSKISRCVNDHRELIRRCKPVIPNVLHDRAQDNWEPLLGIAEVSGERWAQLARKAAISLTGVTDSSSVGNELLADIQEVIEQKRLIKIPSADLIRFLCDDDEKPWATYNRGNPIKARQLSKRLKEYGIVSKTIRISSDATQKGYEVSQFDEAFARYLAPTPSPSVTTSHPNTDAGFDVTKGQSRYPSENASVTAKPNTGAGCDDVTDKTGGYGDERESEGVIEVEL